VNASDERIMAALCRWAEAKYHLTGVTRVYFEAGQHGPYSDVTPDLDSYVEVIVLAGEPGAWKRLHEAEESYSGGLIEDIVGFLL
jgi:hypothetical protein